MLTKFAQSSGNLGRIPRFCQIRPKLVGILPELAEIGSSSAEIGAQAVEIAVNVVVSGANLAGRRKDISQPLHGSSRPHWLTTP